MLSLVSAKLPCPPPSSCHKKKTLPLSVRKASSIFRLKSCNFATCILTCSVHYPTPPTLVHKWKIVPVTYGLQAGVTSACRGEDNIPLTEQGGSVVMHETRIREVPGSNPSADQPDWVFSWFSSVIKANAGLDFHYHDPCVNYSSNSCIIKLKSVNFNKWNIDNTTIEIHSLLIHTQDPRCDMTKDVEASLNNNE